MDEHIRYEIDTADGPLTTTDREFLHILAMTAAIEDPLVLGRLVIETRHRHSRQTATQRHLRDYLEL